MATPYPALKFVHFVIAMTGIGTLASAGIGAVAGWSQYAIGSAFHGEDLTLLGSMTAIGLGFIGGIRKTGRMKSISS